MLIILVKFYNTMDSFFEVKVEIDQERCKTCLSVGRQLSPLGDYTKILTKLVPDIPMSKYTPDMLVCWECISFLHNALKFQHRVKSANEILELQPGCFCMSLSTLTTAEVDNSSCYTFYEKESNNNKDLEIEYDNNDVQDNFNPEDNKQEIEIEKEMEPTQNLTVKKTTQSNKWAKKRALLNKKPKFKILNDSQIKDIFRRVQIDVGLERKRDKDSESAFKCKSCVLKFDMECLMVEHVQNVHNADPGPYTCEICQKTIKEKHRLASHIKSHRYNFVCNICGRCLNKDERHKHMIVEHKNIFQCMKCELMFDSRSDVLTHYKELHEKYICDLCGVSFKMRYCIKLHIRRQHTSLQCDQCCKRFARYNGLWLHKKTHHSTPAQQAYCVECDKTYADIYRYRWHLANSVRHKAKKKVSIPCPSCDKVFSKGIYMKDHYDLVHLKNYKYRCEECNKNFTRNADLVKHTRRVHEGIKPSKDKVCYICGRGFTTNKILTNHIRTHTGERPHKCARCPASFAQRAALLGHVRSLHRE